jgi:hypothetical protein
MGDHIEFLGRSAYYNTISKPESREHPTRVIKFDLSFKSVGDLELLLGMKPTDEVIVGGEKMIYERFKKEVLERTHRIYVSEDGRLFDQMDGSC